MQILTNKNSELLGEAIKPYIKSKSQISILASYFTIYAFESLKKELSKVDHFRFIFDEPTFINKNPKTNSQKNRENKLFNDIDEIAFRNKLDQVKIARECAHWIKEKVEFKSVTEQSYSNQIMSILTKDEGISILGNKSFSTLGLGYTYTDSILTNTFLDNTEMTKQYIQIFDTLWNNSELVEDIKTNILNHLEQLYQNNTTEYLYYVTLYNIFRDYLGDIDEDTIVKSKTGFKDTVVWNRLYKFQKDGVLGAIDKLEKYNGCIIADSVGLGKTFEALAVIKYYELRNDRVLVLCPKKLRDNWLVYTQNDKRNILATDRFNYDVLNHTDLSRSEGYSGEINLKTIHWSNYDLVVIDESHNFRNNQARNDRETRYSRLMSEIIQAGVKTKVLMLSATPVNNRMNDLKNQVAFITEGKDGALEDAGIVSIEDTLRQAQAAFNKWQKFDNENRTTDTLMELLNFDYFKLLDALTIARSRKHIEKYYDMSDIGKFPTRLKPKNIYADIDSDGEFPEIKTVNALINRLNLSAYSPLKYVLPEKREAYSRKYDKRVKGGSVFKQTDRESSLVHLMRINLLKRLESSIHAFGMTTASLLKKIDYLLDKLNYADEFANDDVNIAEIDFDDETFAHLLIGGKVKVLLQDVDIIKWKQDLEEDMNNLEKLLKATVIIQPVRDAKLQQLKDKIKDKIQNPINQDNKKVIIFTAFSDTAEYLYKELSGTFKSEYNLYTALLTGSGGNQTTLSKVSKDLNSILTNFSPKSKERHKVYENQQEEIDILIATDCISEGQNLQDCDYLINYDIHWNPVRIIQRFGRIDRLGSQNDVIQLVNFWPNMDLDEYINLEARVSGRMVLLDISATGEENVIEYDEKKPMNDLEYRAKQLKQLQEEVVDLEDISGGITITDLTLNDFKMDLVDYMATHKGVLENAPKGLHAVVEAGNNQDIKPGVIFCLKQVNDDVTVGDISSLYPHYIVYIQDNGQIEFGHLKAKQILDIYRKLAYDNLEVNEALVKMMTLETIDYTNMSSYQSLLDATLAFVLDIVEEQGVASLFNLGSSHMNVQVSNDDFEVVTYLIVK